MKKLVKAALAVIGVCSAIAGVLDRISQKKREKDAKREKRVIHKPYGPYEKYWKRSFDFFFSSLALIILSPVIVAVAVMVRIKLGSPVLFIQERPGRDEKIFRILKFRTMADKRDRDGNLLPDADRLGKFGKMLRASSLDELPELVNILKGDMSIIGPRPLIPRYIQYFTKAEKHRHDVRPGLSGLAQINGRNALSWDDRLALDVEYVEQITFQTDAKIVLETIKKVLKEEDVVIRGTEGSVLDFDVERKMKGRDI